MTPSSGLLICQNRSQNSGKYLITFTSLLYNKIYDKGYRRTAKGSDTQGEVWKCPKSRSFCPSQHMDVFTNPEALQTLYSGDVYVGHIAYSDLLMVCQNGHQQKDKECCQGSPLFSSPTSRSMVCTSLREFCLVPVL